MVPSDSSAVPQRLPRSDRALLLALSVVLLLPGIFSISLIDRDEGWYAQVSREMLAGGDWLVPRYLGEAWLAKPPLLYWCICLAYQVLGVSAGAARLVSVCAVVAAVQLVATLAAELYGRRAALFAAITFVTCGLPLVIGKMVLTDGLLLLWITAAALLLLRIARGPITWRRSAAFWVFVGLALLTKGPAVVLFIGALGLVLRDERGRWTWLGSGRLWFASPLALLVAVPWYAVIAVHEGGTLWRQFLWYEVFSRLAGTPHGHGGPPGYHLLLGLAGTLPWTVLVPGALLEAWRLRRAEPAGRVLLLWLLLPWVVLELVPSKLPHYTLPCYVPLAILLGRMWDRGLDGIPTRVQRAVLTAWAGVPVAVGAALAGVAWVLRDAQWMSAALVCGSVLALGFAGVAGLVLRRRPGAAWLAAVGVAGAFHVLAASWLLPALEPYRLSRNIAKCANELGTPGATVLVSGYEEPSLFFYLNDSALVVPPERLLRSMNELSPPYVVIARENVAGAADFSGAQRCGVSGTNYVKGRRETVIVAARAGTTARER